MYLNSLQSLSYDTPEAESTLMISSSTVFLKAANETLACSLNITYHPEPEFTSFTAIRTGNNVRITLKVTLLLLLFFFFIACTNRSSLKVKLCFCYFRKSQTNWRCQKTSYQCGAFKTHRNTAVSWWPKKPVKRLTPSAVRLKGYPTHDSKS